MDHYINKYMLDTEKVQKIKSKLQEHDHDHGHDHEVDLNYLVRQQAKQDFLRNNLDTYNSLYNPKSSASITYPRVCYNGGFEDDFLYYQGFTSIYSSGSNLCTPVDTDSNPIIFSSVSLPLSNRFEIVTSGFDPLIGIEQVKFGNKALKINSQIGHSTFCEGDYGIDKIVKEFIVDSTNREFTIWYAVALENPSEHVNRQPFLNINCDLAPMDELCFDADKLMCMDLYPDTCVYDSIDVLDWTCHRFTIPENEIGNIATLEIIVADCGYGDHFGYAYIDGICEECFGSALGSVRLVDDIDFGNNDFYTCEGDSIRLCGTYTLPRVCEDVYLDTILIYGMDYYNIEIDEDSMTFCFDLIKSDLSPLLCKQLQAEGFFYDDDLDQYSQLSNVIEVCESDFQSYDEPLQITSDCYDNGTDPNISDDYYYVTLTISNVGNDTWDLYRELLNGYPNESGYSFLESGMGDTTIVLGPFLIQQGHWTLTIDIEGCLYYRTIYPPDYCSGCEEFEDIRISNITCNGDDPDTWEFTLFVPGNSMEKYSTNGGASFPYFYNTSYNINAGNIEYGACITLDFMDFLDNDCEVEMIICPPKPCNSEANCDDLEVVVSDVLCDERNNGSYQIVLDVTGEGSSYICYESEGRDPLITGNDGVGALSGQTLVGPFTDDVFITVFLCNTSNCSSTACEDPDCFKTIFVPKPDCDDPGFETYGRARLGSQFQVENRVSIMPNPIQNNELIIRSQLSKTEYAIYNVSGQLMNEGLFYDHEHKVNVSNIENGLYILRYINELGQERSMKFVKL